MQNTTTIPTDIQMATLLDCNEVDLPSELLEVSKQHPNKILTKFHKLFMSKIKVEKGRLLLPNSLTGEFKLHDIDSILLHKLRSKVLEPHTWIHAPKTDGTIKMSENVWIDIGRPYEQLIQIGYLGLALVMDGDVFFNTPELSMDATLLTFFDMRKSLVKEIWEEVGKDYLENRPMYNIYN